MFVYLDNSATTKPDDEVTRLVADVMGREFGNPSSLHRMGLCAEKLVKEAREVVAASIGARPEDRQGRLDLEQLKRELDEQAVFVSIMHVNNELGTVQPLAEAAQLIAQANQGRNANILFHTDAVQSWGKEEIDVR